MNHAEQIEALETELRRLAAGLSQSQQEMLQMQRELNALKIQNGVGRVAESKGVAGHGTESGAAIPDAGVVTASSTMPGRAPASSTDLEGLIGLKLVHLVGIVVLLTGIAIGVKYAIDRELISEMARIGLAYAAGLTLFLLSLRLRRNYHFFSAILFSGSMACAYFTTYGALAYYHFITPVMAFVIMIALTVFTVYQAIVYNRIEIAIIGLTGAYGIPFLVSNNAGRIDLFFSYILLINLGVVFLAFRKRWRLVSQLSLCLTWIMLIGWETIGYTGARSTIAVGFTIAFYILFVMDALLTGLHRNKQLTDTEIVQVAFNNILMAVSFSIVFATSDRTAAMLAGLLGVYFAVAAVIARFVLPREHRLQSSLVIQAVIAAIFFAGLQWTGFPVTLAWMAMAAILFITGMQTARPWVRTLSVILTGLTLLKLLTFDLFGFTPVQRIIAFVLIGALILAGAFYYQKVSRAR